MWYNLNIQKLALLLLPTQLRQTVLMQYVFCLVKPLEYIHYHWLQFRRSSIYKLTHTGQICRLRKALNDRFDPTQRRIIIDDNREYRQVFIYSEPEKKDKYLGTLYIREDREFNDNGIDFLVLAPKELLDENNYEMHALIDYYRLASKRYRIEELNNFTHNG